MKNKICLFALLVIVCSGCGNGDAEADRQAEQNMPPKMEKLANATDSTGPSLANPQLSPGESKD